MDTQILRSSESFSWAKNFVRTSFVGVLLAALINHTLRLVSLIFAPTSLSTMLRMKMHRAVCLADEAEIEWCLRNGYDVNARDGSFTPLLCADFAKPRIVRRLLAAGANVEAVNAFLQRPIHLAVRAGSVESTRLLIEAGCQLNVYDCHGSPMQLAVGLTGSLQLVRLLAEAGANLNNDCVLMAATHNHDRIMNYLLDRGALVVRTDSMRAEVLKAVLQMRNTTFVHRINRMGVTISAMDSSDSETNALFIAVRSATLAHFEIVLDYGVNVHRACRRGKNALHHAATCCADARKVKMLLELGLSVDHASHRGTTPLMTAVRCGAVELVRVFLDHGADVTRLSRRGRSVVSLVVRTMPMSPAAINGSRENMLQYLLPRVLHGGARIREGDLQAVMQDKELRSVYESCVEELEALKGNKFYENLNLLLILVADVRVLTNYARNEDLVKALAKVELEEVYPRYGKWLREKFDEAIERHHWLERAAIFLSRTFARYNHEFDDPFGLLMRMITGFMSNWELIKIAKSLEDEGF